MRRKISIFIIAAAIATTALWFALSANKETGYYGLPAVSCINPALRLVQDFSLTIKININGADYPLAPDIGHDPGKCLRVIRTDDASGKVIVQSNDNNQYVLRDFFEVWRKKFLKTEVLGYFTDGGRKINVSVNGQPVPTYENTPLTPGRLIEIDYR